MDQDRLDAAAEAAADARLRARLDRNVLNLGANIALRRGRPEEALALSRTALAVDPHDPRALSDLILALRQTGKTAEALALGDPDRLVVLSTPGLNHAALAEAIVGHSDLSPARPGATMVGGARLMDVFSLGLGETLRRMALDAAAAYLDRAGLNAAHPVASGKPTQQRLVGWANVVGPGDFERPHIHDAGWLSGVYYVQTPPAGGAIRLGGHHLATVPFAEPSRAIQPQAGQLLMFPSYLHHGTEPFEGPGRRISLAFDILRD
jgi:tetratricopeptide (TPR) repeat protein